MPETLTTRWRTRWEERQSIPAKLAVILAGAVAILSVVTGIANISSQTVVGPLATTIPPEIQRTAGFTGALTGFLMLASAFGLRRRLRVAWYSTMFLLPITALQGILQSSPLAVPLIVLSLLALPLVLYGRPNFDQSIELTTAQLAAGAAVFIVQIYGTAGTYALREDFANVTTLVDAFYYTLVTASTVGYGDAVPTSQMARLFGMSVVVVGTASFAVALGTLLGPVIQARLTKALGRMSGSELDRLDDHVLVLGYSDIVEVVLEDIVATEQVVVVTADSDVVTRLGDHGVNAYLGDPDDESTLGEVGVDRAKTVIVATNDDAADALTILTARQLDPDVEILAVATNRENMAKLERAGADSVISPAVIAARYLADSTLGKEPTVEILDGLRTQDTDT